MDPKAPLSTDDVLASELAAWSQHRPPSGAVDAGDDSLPIHDRLHRAKPAALCLSGGGIRSATFGLGVLQGLARRGLLNEFDYISTVSGGGYIGSWLTSWLSRRTDGTTSGTDAVFDKLAEGDRQHPYSTAGESEEISHLRSFSNYLTPKLGLLSADTWTVVATYLRNLIVNWFVLLPFFLGVLALPRLWMAAMVGADTLRTPHMMALLTTAGVCGLILVTYLALIRPLPAQRSKRNPYGILFAVLGPGMLLLQALAMCYVRAAKDEGTGPTTMWWEATWGQVSELPFGPQLRSFVQTLSTSIGADAELLISLMLSVILLNHIGWAIYTVRFKLWARKKEEKKSIFRRAAMEFFGAAVAGAVTGWFLWLIIIKLFGDPMRNHSAIPIAAGQLNVEAFVAFGPSLYLLAFFVQTMIFVGITGKINDDEDREWWARWAGWLLIVAIGLAALSAVAVFGPLLIAQIPKTIAALGGVTGIITLTLGRSGASPAIEGQAAARGWKPLLSKIALAAATPVFVLVIFSALSLFSSWLLYSALDVPALTPGEAAEWKVPGGMEALAIAHFTLLRSTPFDVVLWITVTLLALSAFSSVFVEVNRFSMHGLYRDRLTRAYLGASNQKRRANPFTGFDERDNVHVEDLPRRPFHVVNIALNLVKGDRLAWQQRKAASFTISPLHCGSDILGYRPSSKYALHSADGRGITLGTAMAISGAAVSPNMGYHTSPAMSFLLTLFNVRLGWWLGNPKKPFYATAGPHSSLMTILAEAFGKTNEESPWVYLSDGGHFDNLGLYEMVRRRCHTIVVSDAGRDPKITFEDLGNAIRKIRIDLGIPITLDDVKIYPRDEKKPGRHFALGTIHYDVVDRNAAPGTLIYLKPCIYGKEPIDVRNYASQNLEFPHESTSDQWFTESQFESYRALGVYAIEQICGDGPLSTLDDLKAKLQTAAATSEPFITDGLRKKRPQPNLRAE